MVFVLLLIVGLARSEALRSPQGGARGHNPAGSCHLGFVVEDIEAFHQKALASGVRCLVPPKSQDYGGRLAIYADPDGLPISVAEVLPPSETATS